MVINFLEIEDGAVLKGAVDGLRYKRAGDDDITFLSPIDFEIKVRRSENGLRFTGRVACSLSLVCGRCLDDFPFYLKSNMDIEFLRGMPSAKGGETELKGSDLNVYYFNGEEIELDLPVFEEILLNIPMKPLCGDECRGLCRVCGKNRNREKCDCEKTVDSSFGEQLKSFFVSQGDRYGSSKKKDFSVKKG